MKELPQTRQSLLAALAELSRLYPTFRFGQLVCMLSHVGPQPKASDTYDAEDDALLAHALELIAKRER